MMDTVIVDTAGRLHIDQELIAQAAAVRDVANPRETLLVVGMLGGVHCAGMCGGIVGALAGGLDALQ